MLGGSPECGMQRGPGAASEAKGQGRLVGKGVVALGRLVGKGVVALERLVGKGILALGRQNSASAPWIARIARLAPWNRQDKQP